MDLTFLVPEAAPIVQKAANIYVKHTKPWFIGLVVHGSALKGGFIPGCSDVDFQLYLEESAFTAQCQLPLKLGLALHRDLAEIDPSPFRYIQCDPQATKLPEDYVGPIPGAYQLLAGRLPVPEATQEQLQGAARKALAELIPVPPFITGELFDHGSGRLSGKIRLLITKIWPTLYHVLALQQDDAIYAWNQTKEQAIELLPEDTQLNRTIHEFYQAMRLYYPTEETIESGLRVIKTGIGFLKAAKAWWEELDKMRP
ncbi:MAG: hypothetical protein ACXACI_19245 [Candidatus Hodarchaeales archaeon]|jgi:hypothetical protein